MVLQRLSWHVSCRNHANFCLDNCKKRFLWTYKEVDLAPHPVVGLALQVGDVNLVSKAWILFLKASKQGPYFTALKEDGDDMRLVQLELACKADGVASPDPV